MMQNLNAVDVLSIILSTVALTMTVVGFFASLKFYRDGVELQQKASDALTKLEERTQFIQTQVGGMFDKTLNAAIGKREALAESFSELTAQLESTKDKIIEAAVTQIGEAGERSATDRRRLSTIRSNLFVIR
jgi:predicted RNA-binding protein with PIN domain